MKHLISGHIHSPKRTENEIGKLIDDRNKLFISLSYEVYPITCLKKGEYHKTNHGEASNWFIHIQRNQDFISYDFYTEKINKIVKPTITLEYNNEKYLYVFIFYDYFEDSLLKTKYLNFLENNTDSIVGFIDENMSVIISNKLMNNYDIDQEADLNDESEIIDGDEMGGMIASSILNKNNEELNEYSPLISGIY